MTKYLDLKLEEIHKLLVDGEITPTDLVMECLDRIEENKDLNAFVTVCKDSALKEQKNLKVWINHHFYMVFLLRLKIIL